ncbi:MAG TPA: hypothetical protein VFM46_08290, partial [Pseudomonadales bacterium]|nr:hypothetical protein [Pseudomonadales bacterium]
MLRGDPAISKYLRRHNAFSPHLCINELLGHFDTSRIESFERVLVIPAFDETPDFLGRVLAQAFSHRVLIILVVNAPAQMTAEQREKNQRLQQWLHQFSQTHGGEFSVGQHHSLYHFPHKSVLLIDCYSERTLSHGVGEARKIGCDLALQLMMEGKIQFSPIFSSDADAHLPDNYFSCTLNPQQAACVFDFKHRASAPWQLAINLYEIHLR